jgi:hypothetical protein
VVLLLSFVLFLVVVVLLVVVLFMQLPGSPECGGGPGHPHAPKLRRLPCSVCAAIRRRTATCAWGCHGLCGPR